MPDDLDYESAAQQVANESKKIAAEQNDSYDWAAKQVAGESKMRLSVSLDAGQKASADARARAMALSTVTNLPVDLVERNLHGVEQQVRNSDFLKARLHRNHPELSEWLSNPDNAAVSNDDVPGMQAIDVATRALKGEDPSGILPPGFLFHGDEIIEPLGDGALANAYKSFDALRKE